jgi:hypothetical protein
MLLALGRTCLCAYSVSETTRVRLLHLRLLQLDHQEPQLQRGVLQRLLRQHQPALLQLRGAVVSAWVAFHAELYACALGSLGRTLASCVVLADVLITARLVACAGCCRFCNISSSHVGAEMSVYYDTAFVRMSIPTNCSFQGDPEFLKNPPMQEGECAGRSYTHAHAHTRTHMHRRTLAHTHARTQIHTRACTHARTHAHVHTLFWDLKTALRILLGAVCPSFVGRPSLGRQPDKHHPQRKDRNGGQAVPRAVRVRGG